MRPLVVLAMLCVVVLAGCTGGTGGTDGGTRSASATSSADGNATASPSNTTAPAGGNGTRSSSSSSSMAPPANDTGNATGNTTGNATGNATQGTPDPASGSCDVTFTGVNEWNGGNNGVASYGSETCTIGPTAPSAGSFTQAVVTLDWSSTTPPVGLQFDAVNADGDVLGSVSGTSSPLTLTVKLSGTGAQDIGGSAHLTGVFADFAGTVKVALT